MSNQASGDELDEQIRLLLQDAMGDFPTEHLLEYHTDNFKQAIQAHTNAEIAKALDKEHKEHELCCRNSVKNI